jgi:hypothetical protein
VIDFLHFMANLLLAGTLIRLICTRWPEHPLSKALMFAY